MSKLENSEEAIMRFVGDWAAAELRGNVALLETILVDDFVGIGPLGFLLTKPEWLARHQSGDLKYSAFSIDEVKVRMYHDAASIICRQQQQATYRGATIPGEFRSSLLVVQQAGQWQLATQQLSAIGQPPGRPQA